MVEVETVFKNTVKNGEVKIGEKEVKQVLKNGKAKMVVIADNCPYSEELQNLAEKKETPVYNYKANSIDLGYSCGKAYAVSSFAVLKDGGSNILKIVK
ncbi:MAG: 50S ribosomal protein L30e [Candidatus Thermoplasmatota archaeon]